MTPIEYLRQFKFGSFAVFDIIVSYAIFYLLSPLLTKLFLKLRLKIGRTQWMWLVLPISVVVHLLFGAITPLTAMILDPNGYYIIKAILLVMLVMGIKDIEIVRKNS